MMTLNLSTLREINHQATKSMKSLIFFVLLLPPLLAGCAAPLAAEVEAGPASESLMATIVLSTPVETAAPTPTNFTSISDPTSTSTPVLPRLISATVTPAAVTLPSATLTMTVRLSSPPVTPVILPTSTITLGQVTDRYLLVNQDEQIMYVYEKGVEIRAIPVSTGAPAANAFTPAWEGVVGNYWGSGSFRNGLRADYMWYLFPGEWGSILIHSVPYTGAGESKLYDRLDALGIEPVSTGCVRISPDDAKWLTTWNPVGAPITITRWSGPIGPPDESLPQVNEEPPGQVITSAYRLNGP
jgi:lipoprotein-anchoring transpeptidase ErfK/SrfK